jgi:4'-phosphopantetheinyl transferase
MEPMHAQLQLVALDDAHSRSEKAGSHWLTPAEALRLAAISAARRRRQFLAGHWLLRTLAASTCGGEPGEWTLVADEDPRPRLTSPGRTPLWASLSHSGDLLAAAVAAQPLGLDLEQPKPGRNLAGLSRFVLSAAEAEQVAAAPTEAEQRRRFYLFWTLKEAWAKRSGAGLQPSRARAVYSEPCAAPHAEACAWPLPGEGHLALAGWPGLKVSGLPATSEPRTCWRYAASG